MNQTRDAEFEPAWLEIYLLVEEGKASRQEIAGLFGSMLYRVLLQRRDA